MKYSTATTTKAVTRGQTRERDDVDIRNEIGCDGFDGFSGPGENLPLLEINLGRPLSGFLFASRNRAVHGRRNPRTGDLAQRET
jgi:hypothetical protein